MATWTRNLTGTAPSATDADMTGTAELDNGTAPGDFDPDAVSQVQLTATIVESGDNFDNDTYTLHWVLDLTLNGNGTVLASIDDTDDTFDSGTGLGHNGSGTDTSIPTGHTVAEWEGAEVNPKGGAGGNQWTTFNQTKGKDGVTLQVNAVQVIITYTPASTDRVGWMSWAELEVPTAPREGDISWAELEIPTAPREGNVSWAELETPDAPRRGDISWAELEAPGAPREGNVSWAELEIPPPDRVGNVSWAELESPNAPRVGNASWAELEVPLAPRQGQVSWAELEVPELSVGIFYDMLTIGVS